jgi:hypothetical protein
MSMTIHERPGVYSDYDASAAAGGSGRKVVGVAARAASGTANEPVLLTGYAAGLAKFGADTGDAGMSGLLALLFAGGVTQAVAVRVGGTGTKADYQAAFDALAARDDIRVEICDSTDLAVEQALRDSVTACGENRRERVAVVGGGKGEDVAALLARAAGLNSERVVLTAPEALDGAGNPVSGAAGAAAVAAAIALSADPAVPLNGAALYGLGGVATAYADSDIDALVRGGVTALESVGGTVSPVRGVTTRTTTGGAADATWRELTTILIVDDVVPTVRDALRAKFLRTKNTAQSRGAIRSQVIVELERKLAAQVIDSYGEVTVTADAADPTVCDVSFSFAVAHGLNQVHLTAHIAV